MNLFERIHFLKDYSQLWIFFLTWFFAEIFLAIGIWLANRYHLKDMPNEERKIHSAPVPNIGGIPVYLAFALGIFLSGEGWQEMQYPLAGAGICMLLGLLDDIRPVSAVIKLIVLTGITWGIYHYSEIHVHITPWPSLNILMSLIWIVGMMSAINSLDNMDGLASGITAISSAFIFFVAWEHWDRWLSFMAIGLCSSMLIFLRYNFFQKRAQVFLGDNGSFFIGFTLAVMAMMGAWTDPRAEFGEYERWSKAMIIPPFLLAVPIFDIVTATVLRLVNGEVKTIKEAIVYCGTDHASHRLVALGFSRREAVMILWLLGVVMGVVALIIQNSREPVLYLSLTFVTIVVLVLFAMILNRADVYGRKERKKKPDDNQASDETRDSDEMRERE